MGITVLTLGLASTVGFVIPDHLSGDEARVFQVGVTPPTKQYPEGHPIYRLVYESGFSCALRWQDGQAIPDYSLGVIPFVQGGSAGWKNQAFHSPTACQKNMREELV